MPWGWGKEFSIRRSLPLDGPVSLGKNPHSSYLEAVKFRTPEEKQTGHHSTQHTDSPFPAFSYVLHVAWCPQVQIVLGSAHPESSLCLSAAEVEEGQSPGRLGWGKGTGVSGPFRKPSKHFCFSSRYMH